MINTAEIESNHQDKWHTVFIIIELWFWFNHIFFSMVIEKMFIACFVFSDLKSILNIQKYEKFYWLKYLCSALVIILLFCFKSLFRKINNSEMNAYLFALKSRTNTCNILEIGSNFEYNVADHLFSNISVETKLKAAIGWSPGKKLVI